MLVGAGEKNQFELILFSLGFIQLYNDLHLPLGRKCIVCFKYISAIIRTDSCILTIDFP